MSAELPPDPFQEPSPVLRKLLEQDGLSLNCLVCGGRGGWPSGEFWEPCRHCNGAWTVTDFGGIS